MLIDGVMYGSLVTDRADDWHDVKGADSNISSVLSRPLVLAVCNQIEDAFD